MVTWPEMIQNQNNYTRCGLDAWIVACAKNAAASRRRFSPILKKYEGCPMSIPLRHGPG